ncbi:retroviral-like aspartic protease family protein [Myxococcota bacterium]|nr:retroviral-like aspartic protease family protein [Myxococcota bacterium]
MIGRQQQAEGRHLKKWILTALMVGIGPGLLIFSAYLASIFGEGKTHLILSAFLLVVLPFGAIYVLVGAQNHRVGKTLALWGSISWLFSLLLLFGAMEKTSEVLKTHGAWFTSFWGRSKRSKGDALAKRLVDTLPLARGIPYWFEEGSIIVKATVASPGRSVDVRFILDTGASVTTISSALASSLGLAPGPGGASVEVQTASGVTRYPLVTLDRITLGGGYTVGPLTAAICDPCSSKNTQGLLGLNFTSHFHLSINSKEAVVKLKKRSGWIDQREEIEPFVVVSNLVGDLTGERFRISGSLVNSATKPMKGLVFECVVRDKKETVIERKRIQVHTLKPGANTRVALKLAPYKNIGSFHLELKRGFWDGAAGKSAPPSVH